jgi:hypothetical protein
MAVTSDLVCVTSYFNPAKYRRRRENFEKFREAIDVPLVTIECAFGDSDFELPDDQTTLRVRTPDVMWQKERLLNLAIARLPASFPKVAWVDADVIFENTDWVSQASQLLDRFDFLQLFEHAIRMVPSSSGPPRITRGFAATCASGTPPTDVRRCNHGDPGFAWAARTELVAHHRLYDACIVGGGDYMIAHALYGWYESACIKRNLCAAHFEHYRAWAKALYARINGRVGFVPGHIWHRWHGPVQNRRYSERHRVLASFSFDPARHLRPNRSGCWEWISAPDELREWAERYFAERREDES